MSNVIDVEVVSDCCVHYCGLLEKDVCPVCGTDWSAV
jgi:hypothetical protein